MNKVPYIKLKEICNVNQGLQIPISERFSENGPNRYFYITVQFLKVGHLEKFYIENPPKSTICNENDIIIVRTGSTGQILTGVKGCFHNNFFKVNYDEKKVIGKYLYYCLKTDQKQNEMKKRAGITTIPDLNHFMFLDMKIPLPSIEHQKFTVSILDSISTKIEFNNKINAELEAMAKLIYDYWFVQFDFPDENGKPYKSSGGKMVYNEELKREIPEGWEVEKLSKCCEIIDCLHSKKSDLVFEDEKYYLLQLENIKDDGLIDLTNKYYVSKSEYERWTVRIEVQDHDLVITNAGRVAGLSQIPKGVVAGIGRNITAIRPDKILPTFLYYSFRGSEMERQIKLNTDTGSFFKSLNVRGIKELYVVRAPKKLEEEFEKMALAHRRKRELNSNENQKLAELRDWLLPMLMNGQVRVKKLGIQL